MDLTKLTDDELTAELGRRNAAYTEAKREGVGDPNTAQILASEALTELQRRRLAQSKAAALRIK